MKPTIKKRAEALKPSELIHISRKDSDRWFEITSVDFASADETSVRIEMIDHPEAEKDRKVPWTLEVPWDTKFDVVSPDGPDMLVNENCGPSDGNPSFDLVDVPETSEEAPAEAPSASDGLEESVRRLCSTFADQLLEIVTNRSALEESVEDESDIPF